MSQIVLFHMHLFWMCCVLSFLYTPSMQRSSCWVPMLLNLPNFSPNSLPFCLTLRPKLFWSDDNSLEFLLFLARHLAPHPILLLLTYRSEEDHPALLQFLAGLDRERLTTELALTHLTVDEVEVLIRTIFGLSRTVSTDFVAAIYTSTEGNPFFIEEMLKSLVASGEIVYGDGKWERRSSEMGTTQDVSIYPTIHISHAAHCLPYSSVYIA